MNTEYSISEIKSSIYECIKKGASAPEIMSLLFLGNQFVSKESALWDYKYELENDDASLSKVIKQISSFYNSHGGYLIYGVQEIVKDKKFIPVSIDLEKINIAQIRSLLSNYLDKTVDFSYTETTISIGSNEFNIGVIHIPKRDKEDRSPAKMIKNSKNNQSTPDKKLIFNENDVYFRKLDECKKAVYSEDWQFLFSSRELTLLKTKQINITIDHNLPDKKMIFSDFVGRKDTLSQLWEWLSDPFEYTKILAGDGGKGKTSIAYRFCQDFLESTPIGFERIVWLSAKDKQFSGIDDSFYELRQVDFSDYNSFLLALAEYCALDTDELESTSIQNIKIKLRSALPIFPSLIIVDNVDSLEQKEQLQIVDACRQFGQNNIRFLITTRNRFSYSDDSCIEIRGLEKDDYEEFLDSNVIKYNLQKPTNRQAQNIYSATDGSPLLTQSILRLCRLGDSFDSAVTEWKGQAGEDARSAALQREIMGLSFDSKRVILCIFYFDSCSKTELQQACGFGKLRLNDVLMELHSLFLVNAPKFIDNEDRFSISTTTKLIIKGIQEKLATDHAKLKSNIQKSRLGLNTTGKKGNTKRIGLAISQAIALMKEDREPEAIKTITTELQRQPQNSDLLLAHARCIIQSRKPDYEEARKILRSAYDNGQDKEMLFDFWYNCENILGSTAGEIEVSKIALSIDKFKIYKWSYYLAKSLVFRSSLRTGVDKITDLTDASIYLSKAIKDPQNKNKDEHKSESNEIHNLIWKNLENDMSISWVQSYNFMMELVDHGDIRAFIFKNAHRCILEAESEAKTQRAKLQVIKLKDRFNKSIKSLRKPNASLKDLSFEINE
ncbi:NB-ARC domain-containing protein [Rahnella sp. R3(2024)]|uniref:NB-ARC domain-containing protein n=1 Tax=Rahnella sp. R3(2024) TaxID=3163550 RepID=UPI0036E97063